MCAGRVGGHAWVYEVILRAEHDSGPTAPGASHAPDRPEEAQWPTR